MGTYYVHGILTEETHARRSFIRIRNYISDVLLWDFPPCMALFADVNMFLIS